MPNTSRTRIIESCSNLKLHFSFKCVKKASELSGCCALAWILTQETEIITTWKCNWYFRYAHFCSSSRWILLFLDLSWWAVVFIADRNGVKNNENYTASVSSLRIIQMNPYIFKCIATSPLNPTHPAVWKWLGERQLVIDSWHWSHECVLPTNL